MPAHSSTRRTLVPGLALTLGGVVLVLITPTLDLAREATLVGAALGAALALIPDHSPLGRLGGFVAGLVLSWIGYAVRAQFLPDTTAGYAVSVAIVLLLCTAAAFVSRDRLPLWATLVGAGSFAGVYELTYAAAPPELLTTSVTTGTSLLLAVAFGYLVAAAVAPANALTSSRETTSPATEDDARPTPAMETI